MDKPQSWTSAFIFGGGLFVVVWIRVDPNGAYALTQDIDRWWLLLSAHMALWF